MRIWVHDTKSCDHQYWSAWSLLPILIANLDCKVMWHQFNLSWYWDSWWVFYWVIISANRISSVTRTTWVKTSELFLTIRQLKYVKKSLKWEYLKIVTVRLIQNILISVLILKLTEIDDSDSEIDIRINFWIAFIYKCSLNKSVIQLSQSSN